MGLYSIEPIRGTDKQSFKEPNMGPLIPKFCGPQLISTSIFQPQIKQPSLQPYQSVHHGNPNKPRTWNQFQTPQKHMLPIHPKPKPWHPPITSNPQTKMLFPLKITNTLNENQSKAGRIRRLVLSNEGRAKLNTLPDREFYAYPRFVTHVDSGFIDMLTNLYRQRLRPGSEILDLMSSWVSHLPKEVVYKRVVGHGLNAQELARNSRLDYFFVKDLNQDQRLEMEDGSFDGVLCTVSVQYLQQPEKVFAEVFRVLRPGGVFIVSFSNRLFYEKATSAWRDGTAYSRVQLILQYFQCIEGFTQPEVVRNLPTAGYAQAEKSRFSWFIKWLPLFSGSDPFYAVIAYKNFKPTYE